MRLNWIANMAVALVLCLIFAGLAFSQDDQAGAAPKYALGPDGDHQDLMSPMGRLARAVSEARAKLPKRGNGRSFHALLDPSSKPDGCDAGDEDCSETGYQEGPGATQSEMAIAIDSTGQHIVVGFNDFRGFNVNPTSLSGYAYSDDGGLTFTDGQQLPNTAQGQLGGTQLPEVFGDPDIKYVPGGAGCQFIYSSIFVAGLGAPPNYTGAVQTMSVHRSTDCGHTWAGPFAIPPASNPHGLLSGGSAVDAADKEFLDVDPETGRVILSWSNFTTTTFIPGGIEISTTYSDNIMSSTPPTWSVRNILNAGSTYSDTGSQPRFAGNGSNNVYVVWSSSSRVTGLVNERVATSIDNGATFGPPVALNGSDFFPTDQILGDDRIHSFPFMAVDNSGGASKNNVYVVYANNNNRDGSDITFQRSTNGGASFSPGVLLNSRPGSDRSQWFPVIAVDSTTGRINVMFDDQGVASSGDVMQMSWMYSDDGGVTWSKPSPITRPFHAGYGNDTSQPNLGDYNMGVAQQGSFYVAFPNVPNIPFFNDGQPTNSIGYPTFLGNTVPGGTAPAPGFARLMTAKAALDLGAMTFTDSGGNGFIDAGDQVRFTIPLRNYVTNLAVGTTTYTNVAATLSTTTPGVTLQRATSAYANIAPGATQNNSLVYVLTLSPSFVPGTKLEFTLAVTTAQGTTSLPFTQNTGTPVPTTIFSENFDGVAAGTLPAGWATIHVGGVPTVPWTTNNSFCATSSNALFHPNANDTTSSNRTRFERVASPNIAVPANAQYVTVDFDICYDTEDDPSFNILAYDGFDLRITDFTPGHFARANFTDALAESFSTGSLQHYPKHNVRSSNANYFQDISLWAGFSNGFQHVNMRFNGMAGDTIQLRPDYTQDSLGICSDVRPGHACGVLMDNIVVKAIVTKSDELATLTLRPVAGQVGVYNGTVTSQAIAPPGGISVNLSSSAPGQTTMPSTVTIAAGSQTSGPFTVTVTLHGTPVNITATGPSNSRTAQVIITP